MADEILDEISVEDWDEQLRRIARSWQRAFANRQVRAQEEGVDASPPVPPWVQVNSAAIDSAAHREAALSLRGLVVAYQSDKFLDSPFHQVQYSTRRYYRSLCRQIVSSRGETKLSELDETSIRALYNEWTEGGKIKKSLARGSIRMLRMLCGFGARSLGNTECTRLIGVMSLMEFEKLRARTEQLTEEYAGAIRKKAREMEKSSIAIAQAFQFDLPLKQKDAIGEWIPSTEDGESDITREGFKWIRGLRWEEVNSEWILSHAGRTFDLKNAPMVMAELQAQPRLWSGPIVVCEYSGIPWVTNEFRRWWRKVADEAQVPKHVKNMDSRLSRQAEKARRLRGHST